MPRKHAEVVDLLKEILSKYFGGKEGGRYRIGKERFLKLMDRATLRDSEFELLSDECLEAGLVITDIGSQYAIQELSVLRNYRSVPQGIVERVLVATGNEETQD